MMRPFDLTTVMSEGSAEESIQYPKYEGESGMFESCYIIDGNTKKDLNEFLRA